MEHIGLFLQNHQFHPVPFPFSNDSLEMIVYDDPDGLPCLPVKFRSQNLLVSRHVVLPDPLVNVYITMENHHFFMGKFTINGDFQ